MWRVLLYLALFGLASWGAIWLADHPETVAITWGGREYSTSLAVGVVAVVVLAILLSALLALVRFLLSMPHAIGRSSRRRKRERGLSALSRGIVAVGAGDVAAARRHAGEAERLVGHEPLTLLLKAQAAQASGNRDAADAAFRQMTEHPETRVLGLRGLHVEARRRGDPDAARAHAEEAARLAPSVAWANDAVLEAACAEGDWPAALRMIERRASLGLLDRETSRRQRAVLHAADALQRESQDPEGSLSAALDAVKLAPDLVPAAALAGRALARRGDLKRAAKILEAAWKSVQHPDIAAAYLDLRIGDSATDRLHRAETLARLSSWSPEARLAVARTAIEAREIGRARDVLQPLLADRPTRRVALTMAELERAENRAGPTREWLARAAHAPRDKAWIADGIVSERWAPLSPVTGRLDAFQWDTPPEVIGAPAEPHRLFLAEADTPEPEPELVRLPPLGGPEPAEAEMPAPEPEAVVPPAPVEPPPAERSPDPAPAAEPAAIEPLPRVGATVRPGRAGPPEPAPVVFPVPHAPDDPGLDGPERSRQPRFMRRG